LVFVVLEAAVEVEGRLMFEKVSDVVFEFEWILLWQVHVIEK
jgi:TRAP-type mannitol/chloroaromatic compound transport system permease small subunit